jgi:uncharacterized protein YggL (DUF469 family)
MPRYLITFNATLNGEEFIEAQDIREAIDNLFDSFAEVNISNGWQIDGCLVTNVDNY